MPARTIALVIGQLQLGGAERQLCQLAIQLDKARFTPVVVCLSEVTEPLASVLRSHEIQVEVIQRQGSYDIWRARRLGKVFRQHEVKLAHSFLIAANAYTYLASRVASCPYIASSRTCIPAKGAIAKSIQARAFRKAQAIIANASKVVDFTCETYGLQRGLFTVIPNGVALEEYGQPDLRIRASLRSKMNIPENALVAGTLGRLSPEKNLDDFVSMATSLPDSMNGSPVFCIAVGDGPERDNLVNQMNKAGRSDRLVFTGARTDIADVLRSMDIFVSTSSTEGLPNAVMEAMAAGLPVVATDVGGTSEVVEDSVTGFLVKPRDVEQLSDRVLTLLNDSSSREAFGAKGRERIAENFSVELMTEKTAALYEKVLG